MSYAPKGKKRRILLLAFPKRSKAPLTPRGAFFSASCPKRRMYPFSASYYPFPCMRSFYPMRLREKKGCASSMRSLAAHSAYCVSLLGPSTLLRILLAEPSPLRTKRGALYAPKGKVPLLGNILRIG